jgi:uncharacterized membrane protein YoaT (DUF817 family)
MMDSSVAFKNFLRPKEDFFLRIRNQAAIAFTIATGNLFVTVFTSVEQRIDDAAHAILARLPQHGLAGAGVEFLVFGLKQAWACLFGGALLGLIIASTLIWPAGASFARYDMLFFAALLLQAAMLGFRLEQPSEAIVILVFHLVGTGMELFKTAHGSWEYPEANIFRLGGVPLFSGFMYAAVGSYLARVTRIFDFRFSHYPPLWATLLLAVAIYGNFFAHHYMPDLRIPLFAATALLFWRCAVHYRVFRFRHRMNMLLGFLLVALFIWLAENIATFCHVWIYPNQKTGWSMVSLGKFSSWYLLMIISFVLVNLVHRPKELSDA